MNGLGLRPYSGCETLDVAGVLMFFQGMSQGFSTKVYSPRTSVME